MGAASLSTAVYQTISQSSTTVAMPGAVTELDTPLPWGGPAAAPVGSATSSPTITPTVADLALRSEQQPLAQPAARRSRCTRSRCLRPAPGRRRSRRPVVGGPRRGRWWRRAPDVRDLDEQRGAVHLDRDVLAVLVAVLLAVPAPGEQRADERADDPGAERDPERDTQRDPDQQPSGVR